MEKITFHTKRTTYQIGVSQDGILLHLYYGTKTEGDMSCLLSYYERGMSGVPYEYKGDNTFSCDVLPQEYPCYGNGDYRSPAFNLRTDDGVFGVDLRYESNTFIKGNYKIEGLPSAYGADADINVCEIVLHDKRAKVEVVLRYGIFYEEDVITRSVIVKNRGDKSIYINKVLSATLDFISGEYDLLSFHGRHMMERIQEREPILYHKTCLESRRGTSSHEQNPFVIVANKDTTEQNGQCYGVSFMYSGNFVVEAERDQFEQTRVQMGMLGEMLDYEIPANDSFSSPEVIMSYSDKGLNDISQNYHGFVREHVCRGKYKDIRRPVLINNWEATYFDFTGDQIVEIAKQAKDMGIEMMVLDDGWFGKRNSDLVGLGDWYVNEEKLGRSMKEMVKEINDIGLKFGLWIEPEMINEDSNLYKNHPDWVYHIPGKKPVLGRNQLVLDFSRKEVVDYIFGEISKILDGANIEYIKMDMNRSISDVYSVISKVQNYGKTMHQYVLGVYDFLERMIQRYPELLIEGCSSGGGRFDAGMLYYTPQIWCSDNTDPIERLTIQEGTSYGYPVSSVGAHVSAIPNHQTGRETSLHTRGVVAMSGNLGYELDLTTLTDEEKEEIKQQIIEYKKNWKLIHHGKYYRVESPLKNRDYITWNFVSNDKKLALINVVSTSTHANQAIYYAKCYGLDPLKQYTCNETGDIWPGVILETIGVPVPLCNVEYHAWQYSFRCV